MGNTRPQERAMTISSSLNAGVAGLQAHASRLAGISDNIANSATAGYRRVETDFASLTVLDTPSLYVAGGVQTSTTRLIDEAGPLTSSTNATDLAVSGKGFIPIAPDVPQPGGSTTTEMQLVATGSFRPDAEGVLRDARGNVLLGWRADENGDIGNPARQSVANLEAVRLQSGFQRGAATTSIAIQANLPATATQAGAAMPPVALTQTTEIYDPLGGLETINFSYTPATDAGGALIPNTWEMAVADKDGTIGTFTLEFNDGVGLGGTLKTVTEGAPLAAGDYDAATGEVVMQLDAGPPARNVTFNIGAIGKTGGLTQLADTFAPAASRLNGAPPGTTASVQVRPDGSVVTISEAGLESTIFKVPLVDVSNPNGLRSVTGSIFSVSSESGAFYLWNAGEGSTGKLESFSRQESATDVASELTDLIQTQRAYSSNAKIVQTVDEMLQETTNLKR
jgi:flagellar hook protein FlgE